MNPSPAPPQFKTLSIIIPCYNEKETIEHVIESVMAVPINLARELIIVDDCSKDGTREILQELKAPAGATLRVLQINAAPEEDLGPWLAAAKGAVLALNSSPMITETPWSRRSHRALRAPTSGSPSESWRINVRLGAHSRLCSSIATLNP